MGDPTFAGRMFPILLAGSITPGTTPDSYQACATGTSLATVPMQYVFPFAWTLKYLNITVYAVPTPMSADYTVNVVKTTALGASTVVGTYVVSHSAVIPFRHKLEIEAEFVDGDAFDVELVGSGTGTARLSFVGIGVQAP